MQTSLTDRNGSTTGGEVLWQCSLRMRRANSCKGLQINTSVEDSRTATTRRSLSSDNIASIAAEPPTDGEKTTATTTTTEDWDTSSSTASKALKPKARKKRPARPITRRRRVPPDQPQPETFEDAHHVGCTPEWHDQSAMCPL